MELVVLIRESVKVVRRGAAVVLVFSFSHPDFDDGEFYAAKRYTHVVQEWAEDYLFDVYVTSVKHDHQYVSELVNEEQVEGKNIATDMTTISSRNIWPKIVACEYRIPGWGLKWSRTIGTC